MKKIFQIIIVVIIMSIGVSVYAEYIEPLPEQPSDCPYLFIGKYEASSKQYVLIYTNKPVRLENYRLWIDGRYVWDLIYPEGTKEVKYIQLEGETDWDYVGTRYYEEGADHYIIDYPVYVNYSLGIGTTTFELEENQLSFFGIDFDYSGFFGDLKLQIGKKQEGGTTYKTIKEWQYPKGSGHVSIPASQIPQGNKGEYIITIYEGDTIIQQFPYTLNVEKESYCEINYPVNGQSYNYYPNVNIRYYDMGRLSVYINGEMYKQIQTKDREGIEVIDGKNGIFDVGMNTVSVKDGNGQVVATVQYEVLREGLDPGNELPEFEAESWVQELFDKIMNEYSLFFEYVKSMYAFLPVEIVGLVGIIMMLSVILWFTGRK